MKTYTHGEWLAEAVKRFGENPRQWQFVCPACKTVQTLQDLLEAGRTRENVQEVLAYSCIGRFTRAKGCDWTLGGLLQIHTAAVRFDNGKTRPVFEFADVAPATAAAEPVTTGGAS